MIFSEIARDFGGNCAQIRQELFVNSEEIARDFRSNSFCCFEKGSFSVLVDVFGASLA